MEKKLLIFSKKNTIKTIPRRCCHKNNETSGTKWNKFVLMSLKNFGKKLLTFNKKNAIKTIPRRCYHKINETSGTNLFCYQRLKTSKKLRKINFKKHKF